AHALLDRAVHANEADAVLVLEQLTNGANAPITQVIDVVDRSLPVLEIDQVADHLEDVLLGEDRLLERLVDAELVIELEPADLGEIVPLGVEEEVDEEVRRRLDARLIS